MSKDKDENRGKSPEQQNTSSKGFASMPHEKVEEIARKGGQASAEKAGHEGMSERGHKGGETRAEQLGHEGYVEMGHKGGSAPHESRGRGESGHKEDQDSSDKDKTSINPITVEKYLKGIHFPADKKDIIKQADQNKAPREVSELLKKFNDGRYKNVTEIAQAIKKLVA